MKKIILFHLIISCCFSTEGMSQAKPMHPPPLPEFYITGLCFGDTTRFINKTDTGTIDWAIVNDKGDTLHTAKGENMVYYFKKRGFYNVCLTADNCHTSTKIRTIRVDTITHADFSYRRCINEFDNTATCSDQFIWILPDTIITTEVFPTYQFKKAGAHPVKLIAKRGSKTDTIIKMVKLPGDSLGIPNPVFTYKRTGSSFVFEFKAQDSLARRYDWNFGDQQFDGTSGYKVIHDIMIKKYNPPVRLRIQNGCGIAFYETDPLEVTAVKETGFCNPISVYPNPAHDVFTLSIGNLSPGGSLLLRLMDAKGAVVQEMNPTVTSSSCNLKYNASQLSKGIYLFQVQINGQLFNRKLMIQ